MWNNGMIFFVTIWIESFCTSGNRIGQTMAQMDSSIPKSNAFNFPVERKKKKDKNFFFSRFFSVHKANGIFCLFTYSIRQLLEVVEQCIFKGSFIHYVCTFREYRGALCVNILRGHFWLCKTEKDKV